jgi:hypothetical protein
MVRMNYKLGNPQERTIQYVNLNEGEKVFKVTIHPMYKRYPMHIYKLTENGWVCVATNKDVAETDKYHYYNPKLDTLDELRDQTLANLHHATNFIKRVFA